MNIRTILNSSLASLLCLSIASCSFAMPMKQKVRIETNDPESIIKVDGKYVGTGTAEPILWKGQKHAITANANGHISTHDIGYNIGAVGLIDAISGCFLLVPFLGLASPGAWPLVDDYVQLNMHDRTR